MASRIHDLVDLTRKSRRKLEIYAELPNGNNRFKVDVSAQQGLFDNEDD